MGQRTLYDAGGGRAVPFYETFLEPSDWWTWFDEDAEINDEEWTKVVIGIYNVHD